MSAFLVSHKHINYIVNFFTKHGNINFDFYFNNEKINFTPNRLGNFLLAANILSVDARYGETNKVESYVFKKEFKTNDALQVIKLLRCLDYQSCEVEFWEKTSTHALINNLIVMALHKIPEYADKEWSI